MASTIEKKEHSQVVISLEASKEEFDAALKVSYQKNKKPFRVPGFPPRARFHTLLYASTTVKAFFMRMQSMRIANKQYPGYQEHDLKVVSRPTMDVTELTTQESSIPLKFQ